MDVTGLRRLHRTITSILLLTAAGAAASPAWAEGPVVSVNIPSGNAEETLIEFARQSKIQPFYPSRIVRGVRTNAISGEFEASEALARMLEGTRLTFEFNPANPWNVTLHAPDSDKRSAAGRSSDEGPTVERPRLAALLEREHVANDPPLEEVTVTGTRIRGLAAITAPLVSLKQERMKRTGYAATQDVLYQLPFTSLAGPREDAPGDSNYNRGTSVNLRGLGTGATLVLVNGRRQPASGLDGDFIDVSTIPWSAVEKIEVMPDGASALYGSDAIGGVVNIVLRKDLDGAETRTRLANSSGGGDETVFAQLFARDLRAGQFLFAYQFSDRSALPFSARAYAADADKTAFGGSNFRSNRSNPGNILDPVTLSPAFAIPHGQDGRSLAPADLLSGVNLRNQHEGADLLPDRQSHSFYVTASHAIGERFEWFAEGRFNRRDIEQTGFSVTQLLAVPASNAFYVDPFGNSPFVLVAYDFIDDLGPVEMSGRTETWNGALGIKGDFGSWQARLSVSEGQERLRWVGRNAVDLTALERALADSDPATAFNPFGAGAHTNPSTLEQVRASQLSQATSGISVASLVADGRLANLRAGEMKLALGLDVRTERLERSSGFIGVMTPINSYDRTIRAAFAELAVPIARTLDLSVAGRYEEYSDFGSTFNPKIGLRWAPFEKLRFRSSWGTSFRAPVLSDLDETNLSSSMLLMLPDPRSEAGGSRALLRLGKNENLKEESATTWTAGIDLAPRGDLTLSLTYFAIDYHDRIVQPGPAVIFDVLLQEDQWASIITRNPDPAAVASICNSPTFLDVAEACISTPPSAIVDMRLRNLAATEVRGVDASLKQLFEGRLGVFEVDVSGTYLFGFKQGLTSKDTLVDVRDTGGNPPSIRLRAEMDWYQFAKTDRGLAASAVVNYVGNYSDVGNGDRRSVDSMTTLDLQLSYRTPRGDRVLDDIEIGLSAINVFDRDPPFFNNSLGYDPANALPTGRIVGMYIQKNW
jgi:iron complex outermembrane receptor protein